MSIRIANVPKVLFIKGIFKKDCLSDDIFEKKILENSNITQLTMDCTTIQPTIDNPFGQDDNTTFFVNYKKLPSVFETIDTWPKTSNLLCWNCSRKFKTIPVFIPKVIEPIILKNKIDRDKLTNKCFSISVHGVFCLFACAVQYVETHDYSISDKVEITNKLRLLYKLFYSGTKVPDFNNYPSPLRMKQYGGNLTIEEYEDAIHEFS